MAQVLTQSKVKPLLQLLTTQFRNYPATEIHPGTDYVVVEYENPFEPTVDQHINIVMDEVNFGARYHVIFQGDEDLDFNADSLAEFQLKLNQRLN